MKSLTTVFFQKKYFDTRPLVIATLFFFVIAFIPSSTKYTTQSATTDTKDQTGWADPVEIRKENFKGDIKPDAQESKSVWASLTAVRTPERSPDVLFVLHNNTGLAVWSPFRGCIYLLALQKLVDRGLKYSQWHTTVLVSATRSILRTEHSQLLPGTVTITETAAGFPGAHDRIPEQIATIGEILKENGWSTFVISNDHNVPEQDIATCANRKQWPTQLSSDRYHAFLGGETSHWYPDLVEDNYFTEAVYDPEQGYHLSKGLTNKSSCFYKKTSISRSAGRNTNSFK